MSIIVGWNDLPVPRVMIDNKCGKSEAWYHRLCETHSSFSLSLSLSLSIYLSICSLLLRRYSTRRTTKKQIGTENEFLIVSSCRMTFEKINLTGSCNCPTEKINRQWRSLIVFFLFFSFLFFSFLSDCSYLWAIYWFQSSNEQLRLVRRLENDTWQKFTVVDDIKTKYRQEHTSKSKEVIFMTRNWFLLCQ
jgi:hypothetical protein